MLRSLRERWGKGASEPSALEPDSITALMEIAQRVFDDERQRGQNLTTKTATLAGFTAAVLALAANFGRELIKLDLGTVGNKMVAALFLVAILGLTIAVVLFAAGVLRPQERHVVAPEQVEEFSSRRWISEEKSTIEGNMLVSIGKGLKREDELNNARARLLAYATVALLIGVVGVAGQALVLALHELGLGGR